MPAGEDNRVALRVALKEQYHAGLGMLRQCIEQCPDDLWVSGTYPRQVWRMAFHAAFFTHLYLGQNEAAFPSPPAELAVALREDGRQLWTNPAQLEPYEMPEEVAPYSQQEILEYIRFVDTLVDPTIDTLDLDAAETGFSWYKDMSKLSHELMNLRHLQGHVGQLSELLMARGIEIDWIAKATDLNDSSY